MKRLLNALRRSPVEDYQLVGGVFGIVVAPLTPSPITTASLLFGVVLVIAGHRRLPKMTAWMATRQLRFTLLATFTVWIMAVGVLSRQLVIEGPTELFRSSISRSKEGLLYLIVAALIAVILRQVLEQMSTLLLLGRFTSRSELMLLVGAGLAILVFPWTDAPIDQAAYLFGLGLGFVVHKSVRLSIVRAAELYRGFENVLNIWPGLSWTTGELDALKLLAKGRDFPSGRFKKLRAYLLELRQRQQGGDLLCWTKPLALISATAYKIEGQFQRAIEETEDAEPDNLEDPVNAHLLLLRIMCLDEINKTEDADALIETLRLSKHGPKCPVTNALHAERLAHRCLAHLTGVRQETEALRYAHAAMEQRGRIIHERRKEPEPKTRMDFLSNFIEVSMPSKASFMDEILGLSYLAAGYPDQARNYFSRCIVLDPTLASPYMHLGDYFLLRGPLWERKVSEREVQCAKAAYYAAAIVEGEKESRVHSMVDQRLEFIKRIERGETAPTAATAETRTVEAASVPFESPAIDESPPESDESRSGPAKSTTDRRVLVAHGTDLV